MSARLGRYREYMLVCRLGKEPYFRRRGTVRLNCRAFVEGEKMSNEKKPSVFLAGDSIVKSYDEEEFTGGWGQYLNLFTEGIEFINYAEGGRSSRSFINLGLLDKISKEIKKGDYLFIEFCHNDDETKGYETMYDRFVPLGKPDGNGNFPVIQGERISTKFLPSEYMAALSSSLTYIDRETLVNAYDTIASYGEYYYPYSQGGKLGTYKWFLLQYILTARKVGAIPVLVTAPPRFSYRDSNRLADGAGLHGGENYAYIRAMRQLAKEEKVLILDLFTEFKNIGEAIGNETAHYLTAIKYGTTTGKWPEDYDEAKKNPYTVSEDTHFNKFGAYLLAAKLTELIAKQLRKGIKANDGAESFEALSPYILDKPVEKIAYPTEIRTKINGIKRFFKYDIV